MTNSQTKVKNKVEATALLRDGNSPQHASETVQVSCADEQLSNNDHQLA